MECKALRNSSISNNRSLFLIEWKRVVEHIVSKKMFMFCLVRKWFGGYRCKERTRMHIAEKKCRAFACSP